MILVTGASGFVGSALVRRLERDGGNPLRVVVRAGAAVPRDIQSWVADRPFHECNWSAALASVGTVIHAAARVHQIRDTSVDPLAEFRLANVQGTLALARAAAQAGVQHFIFVSSVKVLGDWSEPGTPFTETMPARPGDAYAISKWEAEQGLAELQARTGMAVTVIRPPLVYGPGVRANFRALMTIVARGVPLPLGSVRNQRSLLALDNLVDLLARTAAKPAPGFRVYLAADGADVSTPELVRLIADSLGRPARLVPVPAALMRLAAALTGQRARLQRLLGSLQVDIGAVRRELGWTPPVDIRSALAATVAEFRAQTRV